MRIKASFLEFEHDSHPPPAANSSEESYLSSSESIDHDEIDLAKLSTDEIQNLIVQTKEIFGKQLGMYFGFLKINAQLTTKATQGTL